MALALIRLVLGFYFFEFLSFWGDFECGAQGVRTMRLDSVYARL